jgi:hypothetical protein
MARHHANTAPAPTPPPTPTPPPLSSPCEQDNVTVAHGASRTFYSAHSASNCNAIAATRTCNNGTLGGPRSYAYASCTPRPNDPFRDFITNLYLGFLGRQPDKGGLDFWYQNYKSKSRGALVVRFLSSAGGGCLSSKTSYFCSRNTKCEDQVRMIFSAFYQRSPDAFWINACSTSTLKPHPLTKRAEIIARSSGEFARRWGAWCRVSPALLRAATLRSHRSCASCRAALTKSSRESWRLPSAVFEG